MSDPRKPHTIASDSICLSFSFAPFMAPKVHGGAFETRGKDRLRFPGRELPSYAERAATPSKPSAQVSERTRKVRLRFRGTRRQPSFRKKLADPVPGLRSTSAARGNPRSLCQSFSRNFQLQPS